MLYEDPLTGALHEIPDSQVSGWGFAEDPYGMGEVVYDGLGNPLGWSFRRAFGKLVAKAAPFATSMLGPYGQIINRALPIVRQALGPVARQTAQALRQQALQQLSGFGEGPPAVVAPMPGPPVSMPAPPVAVPGMARRMPAGWIRPSVPYTGARGRRVYLRCSAWPGPRGLVPAVAAHAAAVPVQGGPTVVAPAAPAWAARRRWVQTRGRRR
jgi:hypothetical protein